MAHTQMRIFAAAALSCLGTGKALAQSIKPDLPTCEKLVYDVFQITENCVRRPAFDVDSVWQYKSPNYAYGKAWHLHADPRVKVRVLYSNCRGNDDTVLETSERVEDEITLPAGFPDTKPARSAKITLRSNADLLYIVQSNGGQALFDKGNARHFEFVQWLTQTPAEREQSQALKQSHGL